MNTGYHPWNYQQWSQQTTDTSQQTAAPPTVKIKPDFSTTQESQTSTETSQETQTPQQSLTQDPKTQQPNGQQSMYQNYYYPYYNQYQYAYQYGQYSYPYQWNTQNAHWSYNTAPPPQQSPINPTVAPITTAPTQAAPPKAAPKKHPLHKSVPKAKAGANPKITFNIFNNKAPKEPPKKKRKVDKKNDVQKDELPHNVKEYISRSFAKCNDEEDKTAMHKLLRSILTASISENTLKDIDWDKRPLPLLPREQKKEKKEPEIHLDNQMNFLWKEDKRRLRQNRFQMLQQPKPSAFETNTTATTASTSTENVDWNKMGIQGTCTNLEKNYFRLTSIPDPSTIRPEPILKQSLDLIKSTWDVKDWNWCCEQLKSIRQDLTVQGIRNHFTVEVYETHARFCLENGDIAEYNQCQTQLKELYKIPGVSGKLTEFTAYRILYSLCDSFQMASILLELTDEMMKSEPIYHALQMREAFVINNYHRFFKLYSSTPNMGQYLLDLTIIASFRLKALKIITISSRPSVDVAFVSQELGFEDVKEFVEFAEKRGVVFLQGKNEIDCKVSFLRLNEYESQQKKSKLLTDE
eukprot:TRINITY_DN3750_c0_g1_i1.p1 TRINITY_DN3750_c0_g1~~TRINITY_DN3750_c0_g1_i1.p1  ORF type:complete len:578 (-),score=86.80 TRINITY_DN3750_c0_g1_i1:45-1778(-)